MSESVLTMRKIPSLESFFSPDGPLGRSVATFEPRPEQQEMALAVERALQKKRNLIVEAGTGVGKSFAYLLPCALWAVQNKKQVVVSTYTKALQEQLVRKDLPVIQSALRLLGVEFNYAILMGAENYLCRQRLDRCRKQQLDLFSGEASQKTLVRLQEWSATAASGLRTEIPFEIPRPLWDSVCRDRDLCLGKRGPFWEGCLYRKDAARARAANLIVVNHHLFFSGMKTTTFGAVVIDEAHNLEKVASQFMGFSFTTSRLKRLLDDLCNPNTQGGLARRLSVKDKEWLDAVEGGILRAIDAGEVFFESLREKMGFNASRGSGSESKARRLREPDPVSNVLSPSLEVLAGLLNKAIPFSENEEEELEIKALMNRFLTAGDEVATFLECRKKDYAYWVEIGSSRRGPWTSLNAAPLDVSGALRKQLFENERGAPVILTSATLAVNRSFAMVKSQLGIGKCLETWLDSPYNYAARAALYTDSSMPDPALEPERYDEEVLGRVSDIMRIVSGGIFVLFTSWKLLEKAHRRWDQAETGRPLFVQGELPPHELLAAFKRAGNGVLLGTETFWQGVDVPGPALSCVIITRLPFASPDTPLEEARFEWMEARGIDVFNDYSLPTAIIRFRQGFGRLIRSKTDSGVVAVLDPRIRTKRYGARFLRSIPFCKQVKNLEELRSFFESLSPNPAMETHRPLIHSLTPVTP